MEQSMDLVDVLIELAKQERGHRDAVRKFIEMWEDAQMRGYPRRAEHAAAEAKRLSASAEALRYAAALLGRENRERNVKAGGS